MGIDRHTVSVVIPTLGRDTIESCREALSRQTRPPDEIIIVLDKDRRGPSWARNEGIRSSRGDLIAFTDDDCIPPRDWLECLIRAIDLHDAAGAGGTFEETDPLLRAKRLRRGFPTAEQIDTTGWVGNAGNLMYRRNGLEACIERDGYVFDEYFAHQLDRGKGIALLFLAHRSANDPVKPQKSLLWGKASHGKGRKWLDVFLHKTIGPFDARIFSGWKDFVVFWIGEKCEGTGFLLQILNRWRP